MEYDQDGTPTQPRGEDAQESAPKDEEEKAAQPLIKKQVSLRSATLTDEQDERISPLPAKLKMDQEQLEDVTSEPDNDENLIWLSEDKTDVKKPEAQ